ncbi:MAG TPA: 50S ribosomal protein L11 methyltransferase [Casimicrobiaceae bacterium]|nr:50S ribosomal protein L11 methyltransferase [Casimicrobiaceae bacterium]
MGLVAVRFDTAGAIAEDWADALLGVGAIAVDVADARVDTMIETALDPQAEMALCRWERARITALFPAGADIDAALTGAGAAIGRIAGSHDLETIPEDDWVRRTRDQFMPIRASERVWVVPSWREPVDASALNIEIDPGLAFGTGSHPSTRLCLQWLDANLEQGASMLDYGCGSGILAIAAARLGAGSVVGVDVDDQALRTSRENARRNRVKARFMHPRSLSSSAFDVVVANILAGPLGQLATRLARRVAMDGHIVLSGILETQAEALVSTYARWFNIDVWAREEGWVALAGSRKHEHG